MSAGSGRERAIAVAGLVLMALGAATLEPVVAGLWAQPELLDGRERRLVFQIVSLGSLGVGLGLFVLRRRIAAALVPLLAAGVTLACILGLFLAADLFLGWRLMTPERQGEEPAHVHGPDPRLGWTLRPDARDRHRLDGNFDVEYRIDSQGFREIAYAGAAQRSLWIFGDSYTFGFGVENEETWPAVLARRYLREGIRVVNVGVSGYGVIQMYGRLQDLSDALRPGDVVLFAPIAEDLQRSLEDFSYVSLLLFQERTRGWRFPRFEDGTLRGMPIDGSWNRIRALFLNALVSEGIFRFVNRAITGPAVLAEGRAVVAAARELCSAQRVEFVLTFLPKVKEIRRGRYDLDLSSFEYLELWQHFPAEPEALERIRFPTNAHWNPAGHAVAARAVARALAEVGVLRPDELQPGFPWAARDAG